MLRAIKDVLKQLLSKQCDTVAAINAQASGGPTAAGQSALCDKLDELIALQEVANGFLDEISTNTIDILAKNCEIEDVLSGAIVDNLEDIEDVLTGDIVDTLGDMDGRLIDIEAWATDPTRVVSSSKVGVCIEGALPTDEPLKRLIVCDTLNNGTKVETLQDPAASPALTGETLTDCTC